MCVLRFVFLLFSIFSVVKGHKAKRQASKRLTPNPISTGGLNKTIAAQLGSGSSFYKEEP